MLYEEVIEVKERVLIHDKSCAMGNIGVYKKGINDAEVGLIFNFVNYFIKITKLENGKEKIREMSLSILFRALYDERFPDDS